MNKYLSFICCLYLENFSKHYCKLVRVRTLPTGHKNKTTNACPETEQSTSGQYNYRVISSKIQRQNSEQLERLLFTLKWSDILKIKVVSPDAKNSFVDVSSWAVFIKKIVFHIHRT